MVETGRKQAKAMTKMLSLLGNKYIFMTPNDIEELHIYRDGVYITGETIIKGKIEKIRGDKTTCGFCREVIEHFKRRSYIQREDINKLDNLIPVQNGLLNLTTLTLEPHTPKKIFTFKINTVFNPEKKCPKFKKFLTQIQPKEEDRLLLQEYSGYILLPAFPHHKFMVCVGKGRNGKGSFIRTITGIIGRDHVTNIRLEHLDGSHRFMVANLFGKLLNVCSEPSTRKPFKTELLKQITGQDALDGEVKNKQKPVRFTPFAKFFIQANKLPVVDDQTLSFWDRVLILEFKRTFTDEKKNKIIDIEKTWLNDEDERSGILNWMIKGLKRLNENQKFTTTKTMQDMTLVFKQKSDPIGAFLTDRKECTYSSKLWVSRDEFYESYKKYASNLNITIESNRTFTNRIRELPNVTSKKKRIKGKSTRIWRGIGLVTKKETDQKTLDNNNEDNKEDEENGADGADGAHPTPVENVKMNKKREYTDKKCVPRASYAPLIHVFTLREKVLTTLQALEDPVKKVDLLRMMKEEGYDTGETVRCLNQLIREAVVFEPIPDHVKVTR